MQERKKARDDLVRELLPGTCRPGPGRRLNQERKQYRKKEGSRWGEGAGSLSRAGRVFGDWQPAKTITPHTRHRAFCCLCLIPSAHVPSSQPSCTCPPRCRPPHRRPYTPPTCDQWVVFHEPHILAIAAAHLPAPAPEKNARQQQDRKEKFIKGSEVRAEGARTRECTAEAIAMHVHLPPLPDSAGQ